MTNEEKQLLTNDLCGRLPYPITYINVEYGDFESSPHILNSVDNNTEEDIITIMDSSGLTYDLEEVRPYLRPRTSMTDEEKRELRRLLRLSYAPKDCPIVEPDFSITIDYSNNECERNDYYSMEMMMIYFEWLNKSHFDWRGLIPRGLALEAPEGMYD